MYMDHLEKMQQEKYESSKKKHIPKLWTIEDIRTKLNFLYDWKRVIRENQDVNREYADHIVNSFNILLSIQNNTGLLPISVKYAKAKFILNYEEEVDALYETFKIGMFSGITIKQDSKMPYEVIITF